jgi:HD-GYP domain-containing protein (c-di-GMP phosphodiesterase class II)
VDTGNHSHRVAEQAEMLARAIGYPERICGFYAMGLTCDIGKIGSGCRPAKKGPLDANERTIMQRHCELAEEILRSIPYLCQPWIFPNTTMNIGMAAVIPTILRKLFH